jgi:transcriptional regulator with XRE-family HTH domain
MAKSIHTRQHKAFRELLKNVRTEKGLTQEDLARRLKRSQSFVAKCEVGERKLEVLELRQWCLAVGISLSAFIRRFERLVP